MGTPASKFWLRTGIGTTALVVVLCCRASALTLVSSATFDGAASALDAAQGIALASNGDVYVGGRISDGANENIWIGKYDSDLVFIASASWNGSADASDQGFLPAVGPDGNVYMVGYITDRLHAGD